MKKKRKWIKWVILAVVVVLAALFIRNYLNASNSIAYETTTAFTGDLSTDYSYSGTIEAAKKQDIVATEEVKIDDIYYGPEAVVEKNDIILDDNDGNNYRSTIDGKVIGVNVSSGDKVDAQTVLATIVDPSSWQVTIQADEYDVTKMQIGEAVQVHVNALDIDLEGSIKYISSEAVKAGSLSVFPVTIRVADASGLKAGLSVEVKIPKDRITGAVLVDVNAISYDTDSNAYVMKVTEDGLVRQDVEVGVSDSKNTQIISGLNDGDEVMLNSTVSNPFEEIVYDDSLTGEDNSSETADTGSSNE